MLLYKRVYAPAGFTSQLRHWKSARNSGLILNARYSYCYIPSDSTVFYHTRGREARIYFVFNTKTTICNSSNVIWLFFNFFVVIFNICPSYLISYRWIRTAHRIDAFLIRSLIERNKIGELIVVLPHFSKPDTLIF